jgi:class 3 adenylate cyclase/uncharacterized membrane protein
LSVLEDEVPAAVHRKLTTILCADVVGYSRLMEADEVATLETLKAYRQAMAGFIERHDGRVVSTSGDALLAEFGSVVEAVQCAAEVQRELSARNAALGDDRRMDFRIGVNLGDVIVEGEDLYGEGVNIAARLQGLAEPGGIDISGTVYDQVRNKLTLGYEFIGAQTVKNISEQVPVYRVQLDAADARRRAASADSPPRGGDRPPGTAGPAAGAEAAAGTAARLIYMLFLASLFFGTAGLIGGAFVADGSGDWRGGVVEGDIAFSEDTEFRGKIGGNAVIAPGVKVKLLGKVEGNVVIGPGAVVEVEGKVGGDVINRGGTLRLSGKLAGTEIREAPEEMDAAAKPAPGAEARVAEEAAEDGGAIDAIAILAAVAALLCFLPVLTGVVMAYVNRGDGASWMDSHYRFQIRTFWIGLLLAAVGGVLALAVVGVVLLLLLPFWLVIRCARGLRYLARAEPHPRPASWMFG